jgi:hypothetical protein
MWYDTGTVSVTSGSNLVTGSGTNFIIGVQIGEAFLASDDKLYEIAAITSSTVMVLADNYLGSTRSGQTYKIVPTQSLVAGLATDVSALILEYENISNDLRQDVILGEQRVRDADQFATLAGEKALIATDKARISTAQKVIAVEKAAVATAQAEISTTQAGIAKSNADIAAADKFQTGLDRVATAADVTTTNTKASEASTSATAALTKAGEASTDAGTASTDAVTATTQAVIATTKANEASTSASEAYNYKVISSNKADDAASYKTQATTQAGIATTQAGIANTSALAASASAAQAAAIYDNFDDRYLGNVSLYEYEYIATAGQTTFSGVDANGVRLSYIANNIHVTYGGLDIPKADYTATTGTTVVLADGALAGKIVRIVAFQSFVVADTYTQGQADARYKAIGASEGGPSLGTNSIIRTNANTISENITIPANTNGMSAGPITIADGFTITVNGHWSIV